MTVSELTRRVEALEQSLQELRQEIRDKPKGQGRWWRTGAGRFANDPVFDEIVRLGREYRESLRPGARKKMARKNADT
jgi:hypothetical protein